MSILLGFKMKRVRHNVKLLSQYRVILNVVKNLNTSTNAFQILRIAQDDTNNDLYRTLYE